MTTRDGKDTQAIAQAVEALAQGDLVGLPTETVYGLAANACDDAAVGRVFSLKERPANHPLIVHVAQAQDVRHFAAQASDFAQRLMQTFWPGPLTVILPRQPQVAAAAAGHLPTVALRCPAHPVAQTLLAACAARGMPGLAAPSANRFGRVSPTQAAHVQAEFGPALLVLDGGPCAVGIESAIVDCTRGAPVLLRPGQIDGALIEAAAGCALRARSAADARAPGTLAAHYAPQARLRLMDAAQIRAALDVLGAGAAHIAVYARAPVRAASRRVIVRRMPQNAAATARELFAALREFDAAGVKLIWVEAPPPEPPWDGVRDRLARAAASA
ncbi:MAG: threonylcarbamoyl-AMP synthase [Burkholderiaceae bacterium]|jgi:L-threonylcarbamoyladenylate synthase|nr:threonylcarbamoyl-AMP synthase [Burkholderiaceae bacterium]